jgi:hypothetical protein
MDREPINHQDVFRVVCDLRHAAERTETYFAKLNNAVDAASEQEFFRSVDSQARSLTARLQTDNENLTGKKRGRDMSKKKPGEKEPPLYHEDVLQRLGALRAEVGLVQIPYGQATATYEAWHASYGEVLALLRKLQAEVDATLYSVLNRPRAIA